MGRIKDLLYTGVPGMGYTDDLLRENNILQRNVRELQEQLQKAHQRIKHLSDSNWSKDEPDKNQTELDLK
jgi:predicted  nucleic acid-binding Zn-ribbon protein|tara:strand:+ start:4238 stop:4447 length:210 start_codon:yes stop_codon:yes gene_type:complete